MEGDTHTDGLHYVQGGASERDRRSYSGASGGLAKKLEV